jgi:electron transfer flavoprotein alpha subunit
MTVYCLVELDSGAVADASLRALTVARGVAADGGRLAAVVFDEAPDAGLGEYGVTDVHRVTGIDGYAPQAWGRVLASWAEPGNMLLAAGTDHGSEIMAHAAAIAGLPLAANCVAATVTTDSVALAAGDAVTLDIVRQRWAGLLLEEAVLSGPAVLLTVAADAVAPEPAPPGAAPAVHEVAASPDGADLVVRAAETAAGSSGASLATARVVVGGGRGVGSAAGFASLEELAGLLSGVVGVSRVVTSEGWRPHAMQVGQTGTKITPDLYLACGISGAIQHFAGCAGARHIIAVNTDAGAPMMTRADYAVVGDLHEVLPALIEALRARSDGA